MSKIKKLSKSNASINEKTNDLDKAKQSIQNGAKLITETSWSGKESYAIQYPQGGYFKITKTIYNKLKAWIE